MCFSLIATLLLFSQNIVGHYFKFWGIYNHLTFHRCGAIYPELQFYESPDREEHKSFHSGCYQLHEHHCKWPFITHHLHGVESIAVIYYVMGFMSYE